MKKSTSIISGVVFLILGIFFYFQSIKIVPRIENSDVVGPTFWPKWISILMIVISVLLIVFTFFKKKTDDESAEASHIFDIHSKGFQRVLKMCLLIIAFGAIIYLFGIYIGIVVMMPICMLLHGERKPLLLVCITAGMALFVFLSFGLLLKVPLPSGIVFR